MTSTRGRDWPTSSAATFPNDNFSFAPSATCGPCACSGSTRSRTAWAKTRRSCSGTAGAWPTIACCWQPALLAVPPAFPGSELAGIVKLDGLDDTRRILNLARRGKPAVVIGGGVTALELAEGLRARGMRVHYLLRKARYWGDVLDEVESNIVMDRLRREGIVLHANTQVKQAIGAKGRVTAVETLAGETIPCRILAVATGVRARVDLTRKAGLAVDKGIVVDAHLRTSLPNVFAAGDCTQSAMRPATCSGPRPGAGAHRRDEHGRLPGPLRQRRRLQRDHACRPQDNHHRQRRQQEGREAR